MAKPHLLFALIPYIIYTLRMFKPSTLIKRFSDSVSKESIEYAIELENSNSIDRSGQIKPINDTIQPIIDVLQGSMKSYDYETIRYGLRILDVKTSEILREGTCDLRCKEDIANRIIDHIKSIGIMACKQEMERSVNDVASSLQSIFENLVVDEINKPENTPVSKPIDALLIVLFDIGRLTVDETHKNSAAHVYNVLTEIAIKSIAVGSRKITSRVIEIFARITFERVEKENSLMVYRTIVSDISLQAIENLMNIGKKMAEKGWETEIRILIHMLKIIGETLIKNTEITGNAEFLLENLVIELGLLSKDLINNGLGELVFSCSNTIASIGKNSYKKNKNLTDKSIQTLLFLLNDIQSFDLLDENIKSRLTSHIHQLLNGLSDIVHGSVSIDKCIHGSSLGSSKR